MTAHGRSTQQLHGADDSTGSEMCRHHLQDTQREDPYWSRQETLKIHAELGDRMQRLISTQSSVRDR